MQCGSLVHGTFPRKPGGGLPYELLAAKFEETNPVLLGEYEDMLDDWNRMLLRDWRPDKPVLESDRPQRNVAAQHALNLRYNGTRGDTNVESSLRPEEFLGFGPEYRDPRGTAEGPDYRVNVQEAKTRLRYKHFSPDGSNSITGGNLSDPKINEIKQETYKLSLPRMKWFSTSIESPGPHKVVVKRPKSMQGKILQDDAAAHLDFDLGAPLHTHGASAAANLRDTLTLQEYRDEMLNSHEVVVLSDKLGDTDNRRIGVMRQTRTGGAQADSVYHDVDFEKTEHFSSLQVYKSAAPHIINLARFAKAGSVQDTETPELVETEPAARKHARAVANAREILNRLFGTTDDVDFGKQMDSIARKSEGGLQKNYTRNRAAGEMSHHIDPIHIEDAEAIRKSVRPRDAAPNRWRADPDADFSEETTTAAGKTPSPPAETAASRRSQADIDFEEQKEVKNYKSFIGRARGAARDKHDARALRFAEEHLTAVRQTPKARGDIVAAKGLAQQELAHRDNYAGDRHIAPLGSKFMRGYMERGDVAQEIGESA